MALRRQHLHRPARRVVVLLPRPLLVTRYRGALLLLLALGSLPAGSSAAGAHRSESGARAVRDARPPSRVAHGPQLVDHLYPDPVPARRLGAGRRHRGCGPPAPWPRAAGAGLAVYGAPGRGASGGHLRVDPPGVA